MTGLPATSTHPVTAKRPRIGQRCWRALLAVVLVAACDSGGNSGAATDNDATRRAGDAAATTDAASGPDALVPVPSWPPGAPSPFDAQCPGGDPVPFGPDGVTLTLDDARRFSADDVDEPHVFARFTAPTAGFWRLVGAPEDAAPDEVVQVVGLFHCALGFSRAPVDFGAGNDAHVYLHAGETADVVVWARFGHVRLAAEPLETHGRGDAAPCDIDLYPFESEGCQPSPFPDARRGAFSWVSGGHHVGLALELDPAGSPARDQGLLLFARREGGRFAPLGAPWFDFLVAFPDEPALVSATVDWPFDEAPAEVAVVVWSRGWRPRWHVWSLPRTAPAAPAKEGKICDFTGYFQPCEDGDCAAAGPLGKCVSPSPACTVDAEPEAWTLDAATGRYSVMARRPAIGDRIPGHVPRGTVAQTEVIARFRAPEGGEWTFWLDDGQPVALRTPCDAGGAPALAHQRGYRGAVLLERGESIDVVADAHEEATLHASLQAPIEVAGSSRGAFDPGHGTLGVFMPIEDAPPIGLLGVDAEALDGLGVPIEGPVLDPTLVWSEDFDVVGGVYNFTDDLRLASTASVRVSGRRLGGRTVLETVSVVRSSPIGGTCGGPLAPACVAGTICRGVCQAPGIPLPDNIEVSFLQDTSTVQVTARIDGLDNIRQIEAYAYVALYDAQGASLVIAQPTARPGGADPWPVSGRRRLVGPGHRHRRPHHRRRDVAYLRRRPAPGAPSGVHPGRRAVSRVTGSGCSRRKGRRSRSMLRWSGRCFTNRHYAGQRVGR